MALPIRVAHVRGSKFTTSRREVIWAMTPKRTSSLSVGNATGRSIRPLPARQRAAGIAGDLVSSFRKARAPQLYWVHRVASPEGIRFAIIFEEGRGCRRTHLKIKCLPSGFDG